MTETYTSPCGSVELRLGRWQDVLGDIGQVDTILADPPYTSRVEFGYRSGSMIKRHHKGERKQTIPYPAITEADAVEFAAWATARARNWIVAFSDHVGWRWISEAIATHGWNAFAPVVWLRSNSPPRFQGDGPADSCEYIVVARPRRRIKVGSLPGHYIHNIAASGIAGNGGPELVGQKPLPLMRALVCDYTRPGDLICDPFAGLATTLLAAAIEGRRAIGAECVPATYAKAVRRLKGGWTTRLIRDVPPMCQADLIPQPPRKRGKGDSNANSAAKTDEG